MTSTSISPNHREALTAVSSITGKDEYLTSTNGALDTTGGGGGGGNVSITSPLGSGLPAVGVAVTPSIPATFANNQVTANSTAVQFPSNALVNGVIVQALAANAVNVYIGGASVTASTGFELQPGQATSIAVNNTSTLYVICATGSPKICFIGS